MSKCSFCSSNEPIVYFDYAPPNEFSKSVFIYICWRCAVLFNLPFDEVRKKIAELFPKMRLCSCQEKFIPSKDGQTLCIACWKAKQPARETKKIWRFE